MWKGLVSSESRSPSGFSMAWLIIIIRATQKKMMSKPVTSTSVGK